MSPIGDSFRNRTRMYPGLVNCTSIDWFQQWPSDALVEVATKFIQDIQVLVLPPSLVDFSLIFLYVVQSDCSSRDSRIFLLKK